VTADVTKCQISTAMPTEQTCNSKAE